jgi:hypothetical protein
MLEDDVVGMAHLNELKGLDIVRLGFQKVSKWHLSAINMRDVLDEILV